MVKSKTHQHRIPRSKRGDGHKKALKEKQAPARDRGQKREKEKPGR